MPSAGAFFMASCKTCRSGVRRGAAAPWRNRGPPAQTRQSTCRKPSLARKVAAFSELCSPEGGKRRGKKQDPERQRRKPTPSMRQGTADRVCAPCAAGWGKHRSHPGMRHEAPCPLPPPWHQAACGFTPHNNRSMAHRHATPGPHRQGPRTGEENRRHKKTRQANLAG